MRKYVIPIVFIVFANLTIWFIMPESYYYSTQRHFVNLLLGLMATYFSNRLNE